MSQYLKAARKCNPTVEFKHCDQDTPPDLKRDQEHHRTLLAQRKVDLLNRERKDAESIEQRAKAQTLKKAGP